MGVESLSSWLPVNLALMLAFGLTELTTSGFCGSLTTHPLTIAQWEKQRDEMRREWLTIVGPFPQRAPLNARIISVVQEADHTRTLLHYETEPGIVTDAFLLLPKQLNARAPAAVVFHSTSSNHILQPVGLADSKTRHLALHLVRRGYITLSPRCYIYGEADASATTCPQTPRRVGKHFTAAARELVARRPGWTGMGKMLWDGMRAVDYLATLDDVDTSRIVCIGHSLGAKEALYLAAFDERVRGALCSEGGVGLTQSNWGDERYLGSRMPDPAKRDHDELLMLAAPRKMIIVGGGSADGERSRQLVERARPVYSILGKANRLILQVHDGGHDLPADQREHALDLLRGE